MSIIPYGRQYIDSQDIKFVSKALKKDLITTGDYVKKFEDKISKILKVKFTTVCSSGTSALYLALIAINLKKDDVIVMPAINFIAVYNMARLMNAKIFLADVDSLTGQMTPETLLGCIRKNKLKKIKAIVTMYLGGYPENVIEFYNIKKRFNCYLIEDACHAFGAKYEYNKKYFNIGSCKHSDIAVFSFHPVKTITTGEGGAIVTSSKKLYKKIILSRSHGIIRNKKYHWKYNIKNSGYNFRLSDINCALGLSQLKKINKFINERKNIFNFYIEKLKKYSNIINIPSYNIKNKPAFHLFIINFKNFNIKNNVKDKFLIFLKKNKIIAQYHYLPIYKFDVCNAKSNFFLENSERYFHNTVSIPIYFGLDLNKRNIIIKKITEFMLKYKKIQNTL
jgi:dTDP-4-amino-4,6-dideoxygalactose transaminase